MPGARDAAEPGHLRVLGLFDAVGPAVQNATSSAAETKPDRDGLACRGRDEVAPGGTTKAATTATTTSGTATVAGDIVKRREEVPGVGLEAARQDVGKHHRRRRR
jgi:hypothetical protein